MADRTATEKFVRLYSHEENRSGWKYRLLAQGIVPSDVDENDEDVRKIVARAMREYA